MRTKKLIITGYVTLLLTLNIQAQKSNDSAQNTPIIKAEKKYQAKALTTKPFGKEAFNSSQTTTVRWLDMAGFFINSRGTNNSR